MSKFTSEVKISINNNVSELNWAIKSIKIFLVTTKYQKYSELLLLRFTDMYDILTFY